MALRYVRLAGAGLNVSQQHFTLPELIGSAESLCTGQVHECHGSGQ
jgi:hypothetical protein